MHNVVLDFAEGVELNSFLFVFEIYKSAHYFILSTKLSTTSQLTLRLFECECAVVNIEYSYSFFFAAP